MFRCIAVALAVSAFSVFECASASPGDHNTYSHKLPDPQMQEMDSIAELNTAGDTLISEIRRLFVSAADAPTNEQKKYYTTQLQTAYEQFVKTYLKVRHVPEGFSRVKVAAALGDLVFVRLHIPIKQRKGDQIADGHLLQTWRINLELAIKEDPGCGIVMPSK